MKSLSNISRVFDGNSAERQIQCELDFHFALLVQEQLEQGIPYPEAKQLAAHRFGDLNKIKAECVAIRRANKIVARVAKLALVPLFIAGIFVRAFAGDADTKHLGEVMILVAILARLFFYVRNLRPGKPSAGINRLSGL